MSSCCESEKIFTKRFRKAIWIAFVLNLGMFFYEFAASFLAHSQSLKADSLDFLGDAANYAVSIFVTSHSVRIRAKASILKAITIAAFGVWVVFEILMSAYLGVSPNHEMMTWLGIFALIVNLFVAFILYQFREGDSNMQSVWLCSRNDTIGNFAVIMAAFFVAYINSIWPDLIVAALITYLSLTASFKILRLTMLEHSQDVSAQKTICSLKRGESHA